VDSRQARVKEAWITFVAQPGVVQTQRSGTTMNAERALLRVLKLASFKDFQWKWFIISLVLRIHSYNLSLSLF